MTEEPEIIRLYIRHYQQLLKLRSTDYTYDKVHELLAEAEAKLPAAVAKESERKR